MADHNVTLTYGTNSFTANPFQIRVRPGESIAFQLGPGSLAGKFRITFHDRRFFSGKNADFPQTGVVHQGDGDVSVIAALSGRTTYHCELLDEHGNVKAQSHEKQGGEVVPAE